MGMLTRMHCPFATESIACEACTVKVQQDVILNAVSVALPVHRRLAEDRVRLRSEAEAPFRAVRLVLYGFSIVSAGGH